MPRLTALFCLLITSMLITSTLITSKTHAEISASDKGKIAQLEQVVKSAGELFNAKKYQECGTKIALSQRMLEVLGATGQAEVIAAIAPSHARVAKAHQLLSAKNVALAPLKALPKPKLTVTPKPTPKPMPKPMPPAKPIPKPTPKPAEPQPKKISFVNEVAPILVSNCGKCHIQSSKGRYSMKSFASLIRETKKGKTVVAGHADQSRLITLIETRKMPPKSRGFDKDQLAILTKWVEEGAEFDGKDKTSSITSQKSSSFR